MPRGWKQADDIAQAVWRQILRFPRPPSVSWLAAQGKGSSKGIKGKVKGCRGWQPRQAQAKERERSGVAQEVTATVVGKPEELNRTFLLFRRIPDGRAQMFSLLTTRHRSTDSSGPYLFSARTAWMQQGLIATLKKVRAQSIQLIAERLDACQQFVVRARKRFVAAEDAVMKALQTKSGLESELN